MLKKKAAEDCVLDAARSRAAQEREAGVQPPLAPAAQRAREQRRRAAREWRQQRRAEQLTVERQRRAAGCQAAETLPPAAAPKAHARELSARRDASMAEAASGSEQQEDRAASDAGVAADTVGGASEAESSTDPAFLGGAPRRPVGAGAAPTAQEGGAADAEGAGSSSSGSGKPSWRDVAARAATAVRPQRAAVAVVPRGPPAARRQQQSQMGAAPRRVQPQRVAREAGPPRPNEQYAVGGRHQRSIRLARERG